LLCLLGLRVWERRLWHAGAVGFMFLSRLYQALQLWFDLFGFESGTITTGKLRRRRSHGCQVVYMMSTKHLGGMAGADAIPFLRNIIQTCAL
jgi:hypothetical protein